MPPCTLHQLAHIIGAEAIGEDVLLESAAALASADEGDIAYVASAKHLPQAQESAAAALIIAPDWRDELPNRALLLHSNPQLGFVAALRTLYPAKPLTSGIHPSAVIDAQAHIPTSCEIGAHVVIGAHTILGEGCRIGAGSMIGEACVLGDGVCLASNVTLYDDCHIGAGSIIHSGAVIGADGFGNAWDGKTWQKIPQIGGVLIGDNVEIGANTTIDRGALDDTVIEEGARIDNLVQIAHNVKIGAHTAIAACVGIAGSTHIGSHCQIGGAAMIVGHIQIADHTAIGGGTLVSGSILKPDYYASSYPMQTHRDWVKNAVYLRQLNKMAKSVKQLQAQSTTTHDKETS